MKTIGGLTHGLRGGEICDITLNKWVQGLPAAHDVCENQVKYRGVFVRPIPNNTFTLGHRVSQETIAISQCFSIGFCLVRRFRK